MGPEPPVCRAGARAGAGRLRPRAWFGAFLSESHTLAHPDIGKAVDERVGYGGMTLWEADGVPVSMAGVTRQVAGMIRVAPVYTPPGYRRRGYAGAVTAAVTQAALDAGAGEVLLFTDLANPTSNALYQRLGYHPVEDRVIMRALSVVRRGGTGR
jgi:predicted GNAT family acetyltransferase